MTKTYLFNDPISETLLIPLWMRAEEQKRKKPLLLDHDALKIIAQIPFDFSLLENKKMSQTGVVIRALYFDQFAKTFIAQHENPLVIHVGCGLDTRFNRIDMGKGIVIDMDLPDVVKWRKTLLLNTAKRNPLWAASILDLEWLQRLEHEYPSFQKLFLFEGVLIYFTEMQVKQIITSLSSQFPGAQLLFDCGSKFMMKSKRHHDTMRYFDADFKWGVDKDFSLSQWDPTIKKLSCYYPLHDYFFRWGWISLLRFLTFFSKSYHIDAYQINS